MEDTVNHFSLKHSAKCHLILALALMFIFFMPVTGCATSDNSANSQKQYTFWPEYPASPRIQFLVSYESSNDIEHPASKLEQLAFGKEPQAVFVIGKPYGVEMYGDEIFLCDTKTGAVVILDPANEEFRLLGAKNPGKLVRPIDIAISSDGTRYVADNMQDRIIVYDSEDRYLDSFNMVEKAMPVAVSVDGDRLYIAMFAKHQVSIRNRYTGMEIGTIGEPGRGDGQFSGPIGVAHDKDGNVYVTDMFGYRIQRFKPDGTFLNIIGKQGDQPGSFARPKHIAVDTDGVLYAVDAAFQNVQMFDGNGNLLMFFGGGSDLPGAMDLPAGVCVREGDLGYFKKFVHPAFDARRLVLVSNQFGHHKVSVYAMGQLKAGHSIEEINSSSRKIPVLNEGDKINSMFQGIPQEAPPADNGENPNGTTQDNNKPDKSNANPPVPPADENGKSGN